MIFNFLLIFFISRRINKSDEEKDYHSEEEKDDMILEKKDSTYDNAAKAHDYYASAFRNNKSYSSNER